MVLERLSGNEQATRQWSPLAAFGSRRHSHLFSWQDALAVILLGMLFFWIWSRAAELPQYDWNWQLLLEFIFRRDQEGKLESGLLLQGLFTTLRVGIWSFLIALAIGAILGPCFAGKKGLKALPYRIFVNIIRNTPPLVLLFCVYFFAGNFLPISQMVEFYRDLPLSAQDFVGVIFAPKSQLDRMTAATIALGAYQGAYVAEIIRAGIESVASGQWDASLALGFSRLQSLRYVILPQALRIILPPMTGQAISSFKDSALASLISLPDLTFQSLEIMTVSSMTFEIWASCGLLYLLIGGACALVGRCLERSMPH